MVTVEGNFTELYTETNLKEVTLYLPIPTDWEFSKKALLEVQGRVLVGYDMEQVSIKIDSTSRQIVLSNLPQPTKGPAWAWPSSKRLLLSTEGRSR